MLLTTGHTKFVRNLIPMIWYPGMSCHVTREHHVSHFLDPPEGRRMHVALSDGSEEHQKILILLVAQTTPSSLVWSEDGSSLDVFLRL